ncbi:hypothetical protein IPZ59_06555 [Mongoliitalea daihaiensis]|nr:hypothetical protein IPZ59_06555 [Mongoliitalea daihaiensis]
MYWIIHSSSLLAQEDFLLSYQVSGAFSKSEQLAFRDSLERASFIKSLMGDLYAEGYFEFRVQKTYEKRLLSLQIESGPVFNGISLDIRPVMEVLPMALGKSLGSTVSKSLSLQAFQDLRLSILGVAEDTGYPFASLQLDSLVRTNQDISAQLILDTGPKITFDTIRVVGDSKMKPSYLHKLLDIRVGESFSQRKVTNAIAILQAIPYVRISGAPELSFQNSEATLYLPLQDRNLNSLDGIIGVLPNELEGGRLLLTGQFDVKLFNIGGRGRDISLQWQRFNQFSQLLDLQAQESHVLGSKLNLTVGFSLLKEDTTFLNRAFKAGFSIQLNPDSQLRFFSQRQASDLLATAGLAELTSLPEVGDFRFNSYGLGHRLIKVDDRFDPKRGWSTDLSFTIGNKVIIQNTAIPVDLYDNIDLRTLQYQLQGQANHYLKLGDKLTFFQRLAFGTIENPNLFLNDLFRLGGLQSFRGFNENFFFANDYIYLNLEPRFYFDRYSYFMIFADVGRFSNQVQKSPVEYPFAAGLGFRLETQSGFFNFVYALGGSNTQDFAFNQSKIHFGYTGRF